MYKSHDAEGKGQQRYVQSIKEDREEGATNFPGGMEGKDEVLESFFQGKWYLSNMLKDKWGFVILAVRAWTKRERGYGEGLGLAGMEGT